MKSIRVEKLMTDAEADALVGKFADEPHVKHLLTESITVLDAAGVVLAVLLKAALPADVCKTAWRALRGAATPNKNRGASSGAADNDGKLRVVRRLVANRPSRFVSSHASTLNVGLPRSGVVGFYERSKAPVGVLPCRLTQFTRAHFARFKAAMPFIEAINSAYCSNAPDYYARHCVFTESVEPTYRIGSSVFSTITVNRNYRTAIHKDAGDFAAGLSCLSVFRHGVFTGGWLVMPQFGLGFDLQTGDVLLMDAHQWHGNTAMNGEPAFERVSFVLYSREKINRCKSTAEELDWAKVRRTGESLFQDL
jgi:hypothetical protein